MQSRAELENRKERYDVIIGDLADPIEGGPCYKLYTKSFYELTVKPRLNHGGIFVTQVSGYKQVCAYVGAYVLMNGKEKIHSPRSFSSKFVGWASWNFQPHRSILLHL